MSNPQKAKGDKFELDVVNYLVAAGFNAKRTRAGYERDYGDIHVLDDLGRLGLILQAKNRAQDTSPWRRLAGYVADTELQRSQAGARHAATVVKRPGVAAPGKQYVVLELDWYLALLREADYPAEPETEEAS